MDRIPVVVTGVGGGGHGEQILKALRFAETAYFIVGCDMTPFSKGLAEADAAHILPPASDPHYITALLKVCALHRARAVFHGSEPELLAMSRERERFAAENVFLPINPSDVISRCLNKASSSQFLESHGYSVPRWKRCTSLEELKQFSLLPAVIKPSVGGGGSSHVYVAQTSEELAILGAYALSLCPELIVQEYVGTPDSEYTVGVLLSMDGDLIQSIALRRNILSSLSNRIKVPNRTGRVEYGPVLAISNGISQGDIGPFPEVAQPCEQIALAMGCRGPVNFQCRLWKGKTFIFEINPRFSGTTSLRAMVGFNEPDILIRKHVLGLPIQSRFNYRSGTIARGLSERLLDDRTMKAGLNESH